MATASQRSGVATMVSHVGLTRRGAFGASAAGAAIAAAAISGSSMASAQPARPDDLRARPASLARRMVLEKGEAASAGERA